MERITNCTKEPFCNRICRQNLLETAFTHTSYANEHRLLKISHNERLEF